MAHAFAFAAIRTTKTREHFCGKFLYYASTDNAQHKNCPSSGVDDRPGRDLFRVLKRSPISQSHTPGLRRGYSDGKAVGNTTFGEFPCIRIGEFPSSCIPYCCILLPSMVKKPLQRKNLKRKTWGYITYYVSPV